MMATTTARQKAKAKDAPRLSDQGCFVYPSQHKLLLIGV